MPIDDLNIVREVFESSAYMAESALTALAVAPELREQALSEFRRRDLARLEAQFKTGNLRAGARHSFGVTDSDDFALDEG